MYFSTNHMVMMIIVFYDLNWIYRDYAFFRLFTIGSVYYVIIVGHFLDETSYKLLCPLPVLSYNLIFRYFVLLYMSWEQNIYICVWIYTYVYVWIYTYI